MSYALAAVAVLALALLAFSVGRYPVSPDEMLSLLASKLGVSTTATPANVEAVLFLVRGPRVLAALLVGAALA
ncbi:MAG TPA: iron chelate uptake ABC transporter family permease subunit, partial [Gammaproteobacteria bacterium]|nr:iron chelate uptake ABC transporter family permease subunit [Gammaproteobacteria bacterium]